VDEMRGREGRAEKRRGQRRGRSDDVGT